MEFHQRNNPLHPGRRSTGWKAFLVGILVWLPSFLAPGLLPGSVLHVRVSNYMKMTNICTSRVPLSWALSSLEQWFSAGGELPPGRVAVSGNGSDLIHWAEARDAGKHPMMHRTVQPPPPEKNSTQRGSFEVDKSCHRMHPLDYIKGGEFKASWRVE